MDFEIPATHLVEFLADLPERGVTLCKVNGRPVFSSTEDLRELAQKHGATFLTPPAVLQPEIRGILQGCCAYVRVRWAREDSGWLADEMIMGRTGFLEYDDTALIKDFVQEQGFEELKREEWMPVFRTKAVRQAFINEDSAAADALFEVVTAELQSPQDGLTPPALSGRMLAWVTALHKRHNPGPSNP